MKLARVVLDFAYRIPGSVMERAQYEITEEHAARVEGGLGEMRFDKDTFSLVFGNCDYGIHWSHVREWERSNLELPCEKCGDLFKNGQGLGQHRKFCKGKKESAA